MDTITIDDVAKHAQVSTKTVSRVLNNKGSISRQTREKVHKAMEELEYVPNEIARSLFGKKTHSVGILFPNVKDPFFGEIVTKIENLLDKENYKVLLCNTDNNLEKEAQYLKMLLSNQVDGIIVGSHNKPNEIYQKTKLPIVSIDRFVSESVPIIRSDNYKGGQIAVQYLFSQHCKNIALFSGSSFEDVQAGELRSKAYFDFIKKNNREPIVCYVEFEQDIDYQIKCITKFLEKYPHIDGAFVTGDVLAGLVNIISKKLRKHILIVGYDGTELVTKYFSNFVTIKQPIDQIANKAVEVLLDSIDGKYEESNREYVYPVELFIP